MASQPPQRSTGFTKAAAGHNAAAENEPSRGKHNGRKRNRGQLGDFRLACHPSQPPAERQPRRAATFNEDAANHTKPSGKTLLTMCLVTAFKVKSRVTSWQKPGLTNSRLNESNAKWVRGPLGASQPTDTHRQDLVMRTQLSCSHDRAANRCGQIRPGIIFCKSSLVAAGGKEMTPNHQQRFESFHICLHSSIKDNNI